MKKGKKMEWIGIGILIAIGIWLAPIIITFVIMILIGGFVAIASVFKAVFGGSR